MNIADVQRKINERIDLSRLNHQRLQDHSTNHRPNTASTKRVKTVAQERARAKPQTRIVDLNDNVTSTILRYTVNSCKAWWLQTWVVNHQFSRCTRAVYNEIHKSLPSKVALRADMVVSCTDSFSKSTRLFRYFLVETYNMHHTSNDHGWLTALVNTLVIDVMHELKSVPIVTTECIKRLELCCKLMAHEVKDLALIDKESWAVRLTAQSNHILNFCRGGTKFLHVVQALCDGGNAAILHPVCIKHALKQMTQVKNISSELKEAVESAHVINNLGTPLFN